MFVNRKNQKSENMLLAIKKKCYRIFINMKLERKILKSQEFENLRWINSSPYKIKELIGKVVLIDFWNYTCINCLRTIPYIKIWNSRYKDKGLVVIGIHTPEFSFAKDAGRVKRAIEDIGIQYPVALDNDFSTWKLYSNKYWPSKYLIDKDGYLVDFNFGEGNYEKFEETIQVLLREINSHFVLPKILEPLRDEDYTNAVCKQSTPKIYFGYKNGRLGNYEGYKAETVINYQMPTTIHYDIAFLRGAWKSFSEYIELSADSGEVYVNYEAKEVNIVMGPGDEGRQEIFIYQNDTPLNKDNMGDCVQLRGGEACVEVTDYKLYNIIKNTQFDRYLLKIRTSSKGLKFFAFSFVSCIE